MARNHIKSGEIADLRPLGSKLATAKTTALVKEARFEAIRLIVRAGAEIAPHRVAGDIMLHCLEGRVEVSRTRSSLMLRAGEWLYLTGGEIHGLKGVEDSSLLLTILFEKPAA
jgi:quercetin dioxygenase-like cupin family protein